MTGNVVGLTTSPLPLGDQITDGPGYRMWNLLSIAAERHDVHVLSLYESFHESRRDFTTTQAGRITVETLHHGPATVARRIRELAPSVLYLPWSATMFLGRSNREIPTVLDFVGPGLLESYVALGHVPLPLLRLQLDAFGCGDFLMTTTERERYYLLGLLAASGRLSQGGFGADDPLIHVVRMTPPLSPATASRRLPDRRGNELVVLLAGSFLPWYDYALVASAIDLLPQDVKSDLRVIVMGGNPRMPDVEARVRRTLSSGAAGAIVEFTGLVPFRRRAEYYLGADVALSIGPATVEDELSSRTRVVDSLWARLPLITTGRDETSSLVLGARAGFRYDPRPESLAATLTELVRDRTLIAAARDQIGGLLAGPFDPRIAAAPFLGFLEAPRRSPRGPRGWRGASRAGLWIRDVVKAVRSGRM